MAKPFSLCNAFAAFFLVAALVALAPPTSASPVASEKQDTNLVPVTLPTNDSTGVPPVLSTASSPNLVPHTGNASPPSSVCSCASCEEPENEFYETLPAYELQLQTDFNTKMKGFILKYFTTMLDVVTWALVDIPAIYPENQPRDDQVWQRNLLRASKHGQDILQRVQLWTLSEFVSELPSKPFEFPKPHTPALAITYLNEVLVKPIRAASQLDLSWVNLQNEFKAEEMKRLIYVVHEAVNFVLQLPHSDDFPKYAPSVLRLTCAVAQPLDLEGDFRGDVTEFTAVYQLLEENAEDGMILPSHLEEFYHTVASILHNTAGRWSYEYIYSPEAAAELPAILWELRKRIIRAVNLQGEEPLENAPEVPEFIAAEHTNDDRITLLSRFRHYVRGMLGVPRGFSLTDIRDINNYLEELYLWADRMLAARSRLDMAAILGKPYIAAGQTFDTDPSVGLTNRVRAFERFINFYGKKVDTSNEFSVVAAKFSEVVQWVDAILEGSDDDCSSDCGNTTDQDDNEENSLNGEDGNSEADDDGSDEADGDEAVEDVGHEAVDDVGDEAVDDGSDEADDDPTLHDIQLMFSDAISMFENEVQNCDTAHRLRMAVTTHPTLFE